MSDSLWKKFFKPEVQKNGDDYLKKEAVVLSVMSDTAINGFIKGAGSSRVNLTSKSIASDTFYATCSCPRAEKGHLCKHVWAVLLMTEKKHPDFLDSKTNVELLQKEVKAESPYKAKQVEYKKLQSEKLKARNKEIRLEKKSQKNKASKAPVSYPEDVEQALAFFSLNGFKFEAPVDQDSLKEARKILSKIFHPDKGGTHDETLILNTHFEVLAKFIC